MSIPSASPNILYSFRRCPYAMRARLALKYSGLPVELREVDLNAVPAELSAASSKNTVPVLVTPGGEVIDESWDIVLWSLRHNDPDNGLGDDEANVIPADQLLEINDFSFKEDLDRYKYFERYPEHPQEYYRKRGEEFLEELEEILSETRYLLGDRPTLADIGVFPFIRQFAGVDRDWFDQSPYPHLRNWLDEWLASELFKSVMVKHPLWKPGDTPVYL
ncbi:glutathione S-transferase [Thiogranum longum]|uniref:Glutathione S-transferase n=1 Tax=Thiogranum longum TaxID=1537524 RepID=A0A4R1HCT1_9GAMM|nr:glutathione S-transferase [Thiogranum longum]TCK18075.1 glutathione S-transferase [Thiogranum longum]